MTYIFHFVPLYQNAHADTELTWLFQSIMTLLLWHYSYYKWSNTSDLQQGLFHLELHISMQRQTKSLSDIVFIFMCIET